MANVWTIHPHVGAGDLKFGMQADEVEALLGPPAKVKGGLVVVRREQRSADMPTISYDRAGICEITFARGAQVVVDGAAVFQRPAAEFLADLSVKDDHLVVSCGILISRVTGITATGFHDGNHDQRTLSVFNASVWRDDNLASATPFRPKSSP